MKKVLVLLNYKIYIGWLNFAGVKKKYQGF
jgi:hypothetical protein